TEAQFWSAFDELQPRILGALLDAVSAALENLSSVKGSLPRMADAAAWAIAAEPALGLPKGSIRKALLANSRASHVAALEVSIIAAPLLKLIDQQEDERWSGTASRLLERLTVLAGEKVTKQREWPRQPHVLSGKLQRIAAALRRAGYNIEFGRDHRGRT